MDAVTSLIVAEEGSWSRPPTERRAARMGEFGVLTMIAKAGAPSTSLCLSLVHRISKVGGAVALAVAMVGAVAVTNASAEDETRLPLASAEEINDPHAAVYMESAYPSANECRECHTQIYEEWASSNHAYASISPMFHKFEQAITDLTQGTIGTFCVRCHQQIGTQLGEQRYLPLWERSQIAREGITCITCHRVSEEYGKVNGERTVAPGGIHTPIVGALRGSVFDETMERADELRVATSEEERGTKVHNGVIEFQQISKSEFCVSCHQVAVNLGIKLEVVWDQYRNSPAYEKGVTCQDCHMGKVPGVAAGYETGPSAIVNGVEINPDRRHSNHAFYGPGYPIAHPGIFPHNPDAADWGMEEWLMFDYRSGWGTEEFEDEVADLADAFDSLQIALEPIGGGFEAYWALDAVQRNIERGPIGFETDIGRARMLEKLEALDGLIDVDAEEDALNEAADALEDIASAADESSLNLGDQVEMLIAAVEGLEGRADAMDGFDDAYEAVVAALEGFEDTPADEASVEELGARLAALRASMPGASPDLRAAIDAVREPANIDFPYVWADPGDREDARAIVEVNTERLEEKLELRRQVMENGSHIDGPFFDGPRRVGEDLDFKYVIHNTDEGHNLPSGSLGAQPEIWFNVALIDPDGVNVWESGYVDANGDFADNHSLEVAAGNIPFDRQLVNLQTKFLTTNVKGTDREMYLPVSFDIDQRPLLRPAGQPTTVLNHPPFVRMEGRSIPPLGSRDAEYSVPGELLTKPGTYRLAARLRSRAEPIYFMRFVGATSDMEQSMNQWMLDIHPYTVEFEVE
jgi:nitrate/TMAO reductase-like tetraheme cytochrome c subunit